nr:MAG TPA: hypothetical protein [Bacteriophage sp.]
MDFHAQSVWGVLYSPKIFLQPQPNCNPIFFYNFLLLQPNVWYNSNCQSILITRRNTR